MDHSNLSHNALLKQRASYAQKCRDKEIDVGVANAAGLRVITKRKKLVKFLDIRPGTQFVIDNSLFEVAEIDEEGIIFFTNWDDLDPLSLLKDDGKTVRVKKENGKIIVK